MTRKKYCVTTALLLACLLLSSCKARQTGWSLELPGDHSDLTSVETDAQYYYVAIKGTGVLSISRADGEIVWQFPNNESAEDTESLFRSDYPVLATLDGDKLYVGNGSMVYSLSAETGTTLWRIDLREMIDARAEILAVPGTFLVVSTISGTIYAVERADGEVRWSSAPAVPSEQAALPLSVSAERVALAVGRLSLYEGTLFLSNARLVVVSARSGDLLWDVDLQKLTRYPDMLVPGAVDSGNHIYVAGSHLVAMFDGETGETEWLEHITGTFDNLLLANNELIATGPFFVARVSPESGELRCSEYEQWGGRFLGKSGTGALYYVDHRLEWEPRDLIHRSYLYRLDSSSCEPALQTSLDGILVAYDPINETGLIISSGEEQIILREWTAR